MAIFLIENNVVTAPQIHRDCLDIIDVWSNDRLNVYHENKYSRFTFVLCPNDCTTVKLKKKNIPAMNEALV